MSIRINGKKYRNGTIVRANPVEEVTGTLEKIGIGSDVYEIQGSGGGSGYDVNDYYLQNGQISDGGNRQFLTAYYDKPLITGKNYTINFKNSVDGTIIGTAVFKYTSDFTTYMEGGGSIGTITMIITSTSITSSNYTGGWQNIYVDVYREISSAEFYYPVIYSTEEREIGVWTDNKPLYQKTIVTNNPSVNTDEAISVNDLNIDTLVDIEGRYTRVATWASLEFAYEFNCYEANQYNSYLRYSITNDEIQYAIRLGANETTTYQAFTIQYTKTTDVVGSGSYTALGVPNVPIYTLSERVLGFNNYTLNLTHSDGTVITQTITSDDQIVNFEITKPGIWTLSNTKDSYTKTYTINTTSDIFAGSIVSIIPILSNNTGSNGVAIAPSSSPNYGDGNAWWAFDNSFSTELEYLGEGQRNAYIGYIFNNDVYIDNLKAWMGNYSGSNDFSIQLQITLDGSTWTTVNTFKVAGYSDGTYGEFDYDLKQIVRGFRYYSSTLKNGGQNWKTYEIQAWGSEL